MQSSAGRSSVVPCRWYMWIDGGDAVEMVRVWHEPVFFPLSYSVNVLLGEMAVAQGTNLLLRDAVIHQQSDLTVFNSVW